MLWVPFAFSIPCSQASQPTASWLCIPLLPHESSLTRSVGLCTLSFCLYTDFPGTWKSRKRTKTKTEVNSDCRHLGIKKEFDSAFYGACHDPPSSDTVPDPGKIFQLHRQATALLPWYRRNFWNERVCVRGVGEMSGKEALISKALIPKKKDYLRKNWN